MLNELFVEISFCHYALGLQLIEAQTLTYVGNIHNRSDTFVLIFIKRM